MRRAGIEGQRFLVQRDGMWVPADLEAIRRFVRHQLEHYSQDPQVIAKAEALQVSVCMILVVAWQLPGNNPLVSTGTFRHEFLGHLPLSGVRLCLEQVLPSQQQAHGLLLCAGVDFFNAL